MCSNIPWLILSPLRFACISEGMHFRHPAAFYIKRHTVAEAKHGVLLVQAQSMCALVQGTIVVKQLDLASLASVKRFTSDFLATGPAASQ